MIEVGDVCRRLAATADLDRLAERVEEAVTERIAHVAVIDASVPAGLAGQVGQLVRRRVAAGRVVEPRAQPEGALVHALAEERPHPGAGGVVRGFVVPTHGGDPQR